MSSRKRKTDVTRPKESEKEENRGEAQKKRVENEYRGKRTNSDRSKALEKKAAAAAYIREYFARKRNRRLSCNEVQRKIEKIAYMRKYRARKRNRDSMPVTEQAQVNDDVKKNERAAEKKAGTSIESDGRTLIKRFLAANRARNWRARQRIKKSKNVEKIWIEDSSKSRPSVTTVVNDAFTEYGSVRVKYEENLLDFSIRAKCSICDGSHCENDFKPVSSINTDILTAKFPHVDLTKARICTDCHDKILSEESRIPMTPNGFKYDPWPDNFPELDPVAEQSLSPRMPSIQTLGQGQNGNPGLINVLVCVKTVEKPTILDHDYCIDAYEKRREQQLIYVPVSKVTNVEGVFMMGPNSPVFDQGRRIAPSSLSLQRLAGRAANPLGKIQNLALDLLRKKQSSSFLNFNCRSLRLLNDDSTRAMSRESKIVRPSETELRNEERANLFNFDCCVRFKGQGESGVAVYQKENLIYIKTKNMDVQYRQTSELTLMIRAIGDVCVTECMLPSGQKMLSVVVYISPDQRVDDTKKMLHSVLLPYMGIGSAEIGEGYDKMPIILGGNFNNFALTEAEPLILFLNEKLNLRMNNNRKTPSDDAKATVDTVFTRYLETLESQLNVSYFSHLKPAISCIKDTERFRNV